MNHDSTGLVAIGALSAQETLHLNYKKKIYPLSESRNRASIEVSTGFVTLSDHKDYNLKTQQPLEGHPGQDGLRKAEVDSTGVASRSVV